MRLIKNVFNFYLNASIHVALAVYALVQVTFLNFGLAYDPALSFVTFFGTIVTYNFIKYGSRAKHYVIVEQDQDKIVQYFSVLCGLAMLYFAFQLPLEILIGFGLLALVSALYVIPVYSNKKSIRNLHGIKIYIVALVWSGTTVFLPIIGEGRAISHDVIVEGVQRFLFVLTITLPFEIRDLAVDSRELSTIPQLIGVKRTKILGVILMIIFFFLEFFKDEFSLENVVTLGIIETAVILFLLFSGREQSKYYSGFFVESLPLIWWGAKVFFITYP
ncbi:hypothetical protein GWK08_16870 [Leptobacterium flavescens]|uniref:Prenyltransferase n=1 Tax=Leptobacterium flavescens TaxID=472055 RepID=A0A6P0URH4_9FLAO|nr:hypothetical protein [Leptobacterium flavescens]NER15130.1 hypothetical protein [Leptobacterium flavescens]